jgi:hypothetical protein
MTTSPGFSSRSTEQSTKQFPHRDEAQMSEQEQEAGWSNSEPVKDAPQDVQVEVAPLEELEPGFSNGKAVKNDDDPADDDSAPAEKAAAESKVVAEESTEDKAVAKKAAAKKTAKRADR